MFYSFNDKNKASSTMAIIPIEETHSKYGKGSGVAKSEILSLPASN